MRIYVLDLFGQYYNPAKEYEHNADYKERLREAFTGVFKNHFHNKSLNPAMCTLNLCLPESSSFELEANNLIVHFENNNGFLEIQDIKNKENNEIIEVNEDSVVEIYKALIQMARDHKLKIEH